MMVNQADSGSSISMKKCVFLIVGLCFFSLMQAQQIPSKPVSYPVFTPLILNPAIAGSQNFTSINLISKVNGSYGAQMAGYNSRLLPAGQSASELSFSNVGIGGYLFHDRLPDFRDIGAGVSAAYHLPLGADKFSGLSFGLSAKGLYHMVTNEAESVGEPTGSFTPNADVGMYYYGSRGFIGVSSVNLLSLISDSLATSDYHMPSEHLFYGGAKFVLSRKNAVIFEPSLLINLNDSLFSDPGSSVVPYLKFYMQNASFGTYFKNLGNLAFFLKYQFPRFYVGMFIEYPLNEMLLTGDQVNVELSFGLNLLKNRELATDLIIPPPLFGPPASEKADTGRVKIASEKQTEVKEELVETEEKLTETEEELVEVKEELDEAREELTEAREEIAEEKAEEPVVEPATEAQTAKVEEREKVEEQQEEKDVVIFRVQITSSVKPAASKQVVIDGKSYTPFEYFYVGAYRQCIGSFRDLDEANALKNRCRAAGYNQAFVAAFINDERVTDPAVFRR